MSIPEPVFDKKISTTNFLLTKPIENYPDYMNKVEVVNTDMRL